MKITFASFAGWSSHFNRSCSSGSSDRTISIRGDSGGSRGSRSRGDGSGSSGSSGSRGGGGGGGSGFSDCRSSRRSHATTIKWASPVIGPGMMDGTAPASFSCQRSGQRGCGGSRTGNPNGLVFSIV